MEHPTSPLELVEPLVPVTWNMLNEGWGYLHGSETALGSPIFLELLDGVALELTPNRFEEIHNYWRMHKATTRPSSFPIINKWLYVKDARVMFSPELRVVNPMSNTELCTVGNLLGSRDMRIERVLAGDVEFGSDQRVDYERSRREMTDADVNQALIEDLDAQFDIAQLFDLKIVPMTIEPGRRVMEFDPNSSESVEIPLGLLSVSRALKLTLPAGLRVRASDADAISRILPYERRPGGYVYYPEAWQL